MNPPNTANFVTERPRILLLAHSCRPNAGSELTLGWNRALEAAKYFKTWVICDDEINRKQIEIYLQTFGSIPNLNFVFVPPPDGLELFLRRIPLAFYLRYNLWHRRAFKIAKALHFDMHFDLVHQLNMCSFREPGYLWKLDVPMIWGPIGGAQNYPWRFLLRAGIAGAVSETIRNCLNFWQMRVAHRVGVASRKATVMLAANSTCAYELAHRRHAPLRVMLETGVHIVNTLSSHDFYHDGPLRILWSGVFENRKALHLLLEALALMPAHVSYELRILGKGPLERRWKKIAQRLNVDKHCHWMGWLDHPRAVEQHQWADVFVFSSLRDTSGNVVLESLAAGIPVLCLDHQGMADIITDECGVKLPVTTPEEVIVGMRNTLVRWHENRDELQQLGNGAMRRAAEYSWDKQGLRMLEVYREVFDKTC